MMTPNFLNVNSATGCKLSDLTVTGYDAPELNEDDEYEGGCGGGEFQLQFLNNNGTVASRYFWIDDGETPAGWYSSRTGAEIENGAASVSIPAGTAAWVIGSGYKLQVTGQVNAFDVAKKMNATRNTAVGNCMPVDIKLSALTVSGYDAPELNEDDEYEGGCGGGEFQLQFLNNNGTVASRYFWIDDGETPAGWYSSRTGAEIENGAVSVNIEAGKGAWVIGSGYTLNIPAPEL